MKYLNRFLAVAVILAMSLSWLSEPAQAHSGDQSYVYIDVGDNLAVEVHMPFIDLREHLGLDLTGEEDVILDELQAEAAVIAGYAQDHVVFSNDGAAWELLDPQVSRYREGEYAAVTFTTTGSPGADLQTFDADIDLFFAEDPDRDALLIVRNDFARGIVGNEEDQFVRFAPGSSQQAIDLGDASVWKNLSASISLGLDHIKTGPDHILFVAVLLLPSVLVFRSGWRPVEGFGRSLIRVLKVVSMFTIAHSITFTAAGLGLISISDFTAVEAIIAISITLAAIHNLRPVVPEREWLIAFIFGLFHGVGFASLVDDLEVARSTQLVSLLGRNIGIEIGQAIVVLVVFPALFLLRRTKWYRPFFVASSVALIIISLAWFGERVFDTNDWASLYVEEALRLPRAWWFIAGFTAVCGGLYLQARNQGQLLDVWASESDEAADLSEAADDSESIIEVG